MTGDFVLGVIVGGVLFGSLSYFAAIYYMTRNEPHDFTGEHIDG
jgi:hypothetical protein